MLLKYQLNRVDKEERDSLRVANGSIFQLLREDVSKQENSNQSLARA